MAGPIAGPPEHGSHLHPVCIPRKSCFPWSQSTCYKVHSKPSVLGAPCNNRLWSALQYSEYSYIRFGASGSNIQASILGEGVSGSEASTEILSWPLVDPMLFQPYATKKPSQKRSRKYMRSILGPLIQTLHNPILATNAPPSTIMSVECSQVSHLSQAR